MIRMDKSLALGHRLSNYKYTLKASSIGQTGRQADRQVGWQIFRYFIFILLFMMPSKGITVGSTFDNICIGNYGRNNPIFSITDNVQGVVSVSEEECPGNVQSVRRLMALSYGSCEALNSPEWRARENNGTIVHGYTSHPSCSYTENGKRSCTQINNYQEIMKTHPYNNLAKANECKNHIQCSINNETKVCPALFALAQESYAYRNRNSKNEIDIFAHKTRDHTGNNHFLGWNCSEYVTTAMALAGYRFVKSSRSGSCGGVPSEKIGDSNQEYNAQIYVGLTKSQHQNCSCLTHVDITDKDNAVKPGDLISLDGEHIMIVEAVGESFFEDAKNKIEDCNEENIHTGHLQVRVNHSSSTMGGPGSTKFSEHQRFNYQQSLSRAVGEYIDSCRENASTEEERNACWSDKDQEEYTDYFHFFQKLGLESGSEKPDNDWYKSDSGSGTLWPEGSSYPLWPTTRKYLSAVCKARWYKQKNQPVPDNVALTLEAMSGSLTVIRHKSDDNSCIVPEDQRPKLKNQSCLGNCIEGDKLCAQYE